MHSIQAPRWGSPRWACYKIHCKKLLCTHLKLKLKLFKSWQNWWATADGKREERGADLEGVLADMQGGSYKWGVGFCQQARLLPGRSHQRQNMILRESAQVLPIHPSQLGLVEHSRALCDSVQTESVLQLLHLVYLLLRSIIPTCHPPLSIQPHCLTNPQAPCMWNSMCKSKTGCASQRQVAFDTFSASSRASIYADKVL